MIQSKLSVGSLNRKKGVKAYVLTINSSKGLILLVNLMNGYMRTPKIISLYKLIDWLNIKHSLNIEKKLKDKSSIDSNNWLAGFIDADGHFSVRTTTVSKYPKIECRFELSQTQRDHNNEDTYEFLSLIAKFLSSSVKEIRVNKPKPEYKIRTLNLKANLILVNYLEKYPLYSSKYLDYKDWRKVLTFFENKTHTQLETIKFIIKIKSKMNNGRTEFNLDHLSSFFNIYK